MEKTLNFTIDGKEYKTYFYDVTSGGETKTIKLFERGGSYYTYNDLGSLVSYSGTVNASKLRRGGMNPRTQMEASFNSANSIGGGVPLSIIHWHASSGRRT